MAQEQVRIHGYVRNRSGEPAGRGTRVILFVNGEEVRERPISASDGTFVFANQAIEVGSEYQIVVEPPPDLHSPEPHKGILEEGQVEIETLFVCEPEPGQQVEDEVEDVVVEVQQDSREQVEQAQQTRQQPPEEKNKEEVYEEKWDFEELSGQFEEFIRNPEHRQRAYHYWSQRQKFTTNFTASVLVELTDVSGECDLCSSIKVDLGSWNHLSDLCDDRAQEFVKNVPDQLTSLVEECREATEAVEHEINDEIFWLSLEKLGLIASRYSDRLADVMTSYKALYDLILIETASQQLPVKFYEDLKEQLTKPFECYQCLQQSLSSIMMKIEKGPVGVCLIELADACQELVQTAEGYHDHLVDTGGSSAPVAAVNYMDGLAKWVDELDDACGLIQQEARKVQAGENIVDSLRQDMANTRKARDRAMALSNDLLEAIRRQQLPPSWRERASWLAEAKQGLQELWRGLSSLISGLQDCLELAETISDQETLPWLSLLQYYSSLPAAKKNNAMYALIIGALENLAQKMQSGFSGLGGGSGTPLVQVLQDLNSNVADISAHIPLNGDNGSGSGIDGSYAGRKVEKTVANVLGRHVKGPLGFRAALESTFQEDPETGKINPVPSRSVVVLTEGSGQLSASQGTLSHETRLIVNDALKVAKGLRSISPNTDDERANALQEMVQREFEALLHEAGRLDRPRRSRVQEIFDQLLQPGGHLEQLRLELGLNTLGDDVTNPNLDTTEEAQQLANMDLLDQHALTLESIFNRYFNTGAGQDPRDSSFSGRLAFVTTLFTVVASSAREVAADMDAVGFTEAERRTTFIIDPTVSGTFRISIDGILSWIENFALEEGPDLIDRSGRIGLQRIIGIVNTRLTPLVEELLLISRGRSRLNPSAPHPGLRHGRVRNALEQLLYQLQQFNP